MLDDAYRKVYESVDENYQGFAEVDVVGLPMSETQETEIDGAHIGGRTHPSVLVSYEIVPDVKSWGWAGILVRLTKPVTVTGTVITTEVVAGRRPKITRTPLRIDVDFKKLSVSFETSDIIAPKEIYLSLSGNMTVDYTESYITFYRPTGPK